MTACEGARAENLFLRHQLALYIERRAKQRGLDSLHAHLEEGEKPADISNTSDVKC